MAKDDEKEGGEEKKGGGMGKIIMLAPLLLLIGAAVWFFFLRSEEPAGPVELPPPVPGAVADLDPITINLAGGHFLKLGLSLQPTADAAELSGSKALDLAIDEFSGRSITELSTDDGRARAKEELLARVKLAYLPAETELETALPDFDWPSSDEDAEESDEASDDEASDEESADEEESSGSRSTKSESKKTVADLTTLTGDDAIAAAEALQVQPLVYEIFFTQFVMQ